MQSDDVYRRMRADIVSGRLKPKSALTETILAAKYGASRTPVRESLRRLEHDGLVVRGARGMEVKLATPEEIDAIYEVRITLEGLAARSAALRRNSVDLVRIEARRSDELAAPHAPWALRSDLNQAFHEEIWNASHNSVLVDLLTRLNLHRNAYPTTTLSHDNRWETAVRQHAEIAEAIRHGDPDAAQAAAEQHMADARQVRLEMWQRGIDSM